MNIRYMKIPEEEDKKSVFFCYTPSCAIVAIFVRSSMSMRFTMGTHINPGNIPGLKSGGSTSYMIISKKHISPGWQGGWHPVIR